MGVAPVTRFEQEAQRDQVDLELERLTTELHSTVRPAGLIGQSDGMRTIQALIGKATDHSFPVVIFGKTGTGKEVTARCIHDSGPRKGRPFVAVDCTSLTPTLIESELFGHVRGAFTGADTDKKGLIEAAQDGTLFLDEIGDFPKELQAKLLRVVQEREVRPVGSTQTRPVNARMIAATNCDLQTAIKKGTFREDLYYRLNVFPIELPPLQDRRMDIPLLVAAFLEKHKGLRPITGIAEDFWQAVLSYDWPGNVRELENFVQRCIALGNGPMLHNENISHILQLAGEKCVPEDKILRLDLLERRTIIRVMQDTNGDKRIAARILGIGRTTLYRKLKEYGFKPELPAQIISEIYRE
jgi:DNA-binding NtrC family response regulator